MISRKQLHRLDAGRNTHYYTDQQDDYYNKDAVDGSHDLHDSASQWQGEGAKHLGLTGKVDPVRFANMLRGEIAPGLKTNRTVRNDADKRTALDLTFSAPKSITIQALVGKDPAVVRAHDQAVTKTLEYIERELARARRTVDGKTYVEKTDNLVIAKWRHETARPTADAPPDPQLHTHAIIMNFTQRADGSWAALTNDEIVQRIKLLDAIYLSELAKELESQGYNLRHEAGSFELAHISRAQIEVFSKRGQQVNEELAKNNLTRLTATHAMKQGIVLAKRLRKMANNLSRQSLQSNWEEQAKEAGIDFSNAKFTPTLAPHGHHHEQDLVRPEDASPALQPPTQAEQPTSITINPSDLMPRSPSQHHGEHESTPSESWPTTPLPAGPVDASRPLPSPSVPVPAAETHVPPHQESPTSQGTPSTSSPTASTKNPTLIAERAIAWAIKHFTERESVMERDALLNKAFQHAGASTTILALEAAVTAQVRSGHLIEETARYTPAKRINGPTLTPAEWVKDLQARGMSKRKAAAKVRQGIAKGDLEAVAPRYTTQVAREREKRILQIERDGRGTRQPIVAQDQASSLLAGFKLTPGQEAASTTILTTSNRVVGVQGLAGTGKSYMLEKVKQVLEPRGHKLVALASYGSQVEELRALGIESRTVASFVNAKKPEKFELGHNTVLVVDEAGVLATRNLERVMQIAEQFGCRVVLIGDTEQTKAIEAGRPFAQLQANGMETPRMADIQRQKDPVLRRAVELAEEGKANESITLLKSRIQEVSKKSDRYQAIAAQYAALSEDDRSQTLVLTGTNASRKTLNELIHNELGLQGKGHERQLLVRLDTTQAERSHAGYYKTGDFIQPERSYANGLESGVLYSILKVAANQLTVRAVDAPTAKSITFNPARASKLSVYQLHETELSPGDLVKVTRHDASLDLANGAHYSVKSVTEDSITLVDKDRSITIPGKAPLHLDLAYVGTVHGSQGQTKDRVIMNLETNSRTTKRDTFYVGISRVRDDLAIYTDNLNNLAQAVNRNEIKTAALDVEKSHRPASRALEPAADPTSAQATAKKAAIPKQSSKGDAQKSEKTLAAERAVSWAVKHLTERESVFTRDELSSWALKHGGSAVSIESVKAELGRRVQKGSLLQATSRFYPANSETKVEMTARAWANVLVKQGHSKRKANAIVRQGIASGRLLEADPLYTTQTAREREKRILQIERDGRNTVTPVLSETQAEAQLNAFTLKPGQHVAAQTILTTTHRVIGVQGQAGTGKSYMLEKVKAIADQQGFNIVGLASYGTQVKELRDLGIDAQTVSSFVNTKKPEKLPISEKTILVVDEAGVISTQNMERLLQLVERFGCRVVLLGDTAQTKAIEAGRPFAQLQNAGMHTSLMSDIVRQQDPVLRHAVELAAVGKSTESITTLTNHIIQCGEPSGKESGRGEFDREASDRRRYQKIASDYATLTPSEREKTLIITGTNKSRKEINEAVREQLGLAGNGKEKEFLENKDMTKSQQRHARYYKEGDFIIPERTYKNGLHADVLYKIVDIHGSQLEVTNVAAPEAPNIKFNPSRANRLSVFTKNSSDISIGDKIRITRKNENLKIANGQEFTVSGINEESISLTNGSRTVDIKTSQPLHMELAYARTVHSAQGQTRDRVLINLEARSLTTKKDVYYVAISREKHHATIYTDSIAGLPKAVSRESIKTAALDIEKSQPARHSQTQERTHQAGLERT